MEGGLGRRVLIHGAEFRLITRGNPRKKKKGKRNRDMEAANEFCNVGDRLECGDLSRRGDLVPFEQFESSRGRTGWPEPIVDNLNRGRTG